jgi:pimeloyl-ACP methyl ester carboxylesterase
LPTEVKKISEVPVQCGSRAAALKVEEHWLPLAGGRMRYLKAGSGRPVILVHGLLGYSFSWRFTMPALAPFATAYAVDNLGAGLSLAAPNMDCTMGATADRLLQFADALDIGEFDLVGTSHGGAVAMMAAALCAERGDSRLRRLVLVAPANPWSAHGQLLAPVLGSPLGKVMFRNTIGSWRFLDPLWLRRMFGDATKIPPDSVNGYRIPVLQNQAYEHALHIVSTWTADMKELKAEIPKIANYRTLMIWGTRDRLVYFSSAEPLRSTFRDAHLVALKGVGHLPYEEAPTEFNCGLVHFLREPSPPTDI